jgi:cation transport ATPase
MSLQPFKPNWHNPEYEAAVRAIKEREGRLKWVVWIFTILAALCVLCPSDLQWDEAISIQLSNGDLAARLLFGGTFCYLGFVTVRSVLWREFVFAAMCAATVIALAIIAVTTTTSMTHQTTFICLAVTLVAIQWVFFLVYERSLLLIFAVAAFAGAALCFWHLGYGERLLVLSSCVGINVIYFHNSQNRDLPNNLPPKPPY